MRDLHDRYLTDPLFRTIVDQMSMLLETAHMTPTEVREAAMLAQIQYEDRHPRPVMIERDFAQRLQSERERHPFARPPWWP